MVAHPVTASSQGRKDDTEGAVSFRMQHHLSSSSVCHQNHDGSAVGLLLLAISYGQIADNTRIILPHTSLFTLTFNLPHRYRSNPVTNGILIVRVYTKCSVKIGNGFIPLAFFSPRYASPDKGIDISRVYANGFRVVFYRPVILAFAAPILASIKPRRNTV